MSSDPDPGIVGLLNANLKKTHSVRAFVLQTGGLQQHPPRCGQRGLSMTEREEISRGIAAHGAGDALPAR